MTTRPNYSAHIPALDLARQACAIAGFTQSRGPLAGQGSIPQTMAAVAAGQLALLNLYPADTQQPGYHERITAKLADLKAASINDPELYGILHDLTIALRNAHHMAEQHAKQPHP